MKRKNAGQGMTEYLIIVGLIAVSAIAVTRTTSKNLQVGFGNIANALRGEDQNAGDAEDPASKINARDLGDFNTGTDNSGSRGRR